MLQLAIVVSGFGLSLAVVVRTGLGTLPVTLGTIAVALIAAPVIGRMLGLHSPLRTLIGVGTAICGASAIAAVSSVIEPDEAEIALAIATVFFYNVLAVLVFPPIGHALGLGQEAFGLWAGTAINDTSSVVAAGYIYGRDAGDHATIVKLTRASLILPIVAVIAVRHARATRAAGAKVPWRRIVPWFILWFLVAALMNSTGLVPAGLARRDRERRDLPHQRGAGGDRPADSAAPGSARRPAAVGAGVRAVGRGGAVVARDPAGDRPLSAVTPSTV